MEDTRQKLCYVYEHAFNRKPPAHVVLLEKEQEIRNVEQIEQLKREANSIVVSLKKKLQEREKLIKEADGRPLPEIAVCSQEIRNMFIVMDQTKEDLQKRRIAFQNQGNTNYADQMKDYIEQFIDAKEKLKNWELDRNKQEKQEFNPLYKLSKQVIKNETVSAKQQIVKDVVSTNQSLDDLLPQFKDFEEAVSHVRAQDEALESQAARMIDKVQLIKQQVLKHKEVLDIQDEMMEDLHKQMNNANDELKGINKTAKDIQNRIMKGSNCIMIIIIVAICMIAAWWIYKLAT